MATNTMRPSTWRGEEGGEQGVRLLELHVGVWKDSKKYSSVMFTSKLIYLLPEGWTHVICTLFNHVEKWKSPHFLLLLSKLPRSVLLSLRLIWGEEDSNETNQVVGSVGVTGHESLTECCACGLPVVPLSRSETSYSVRQPVTSVKSPRVECAIKTQFESSVFLKKCTDSEK